MKSFLVVENQACGCDYTIGCGVRVGLIEADSFDAITDQVLREVVLDEVPYDGAFGGLAYAVTDGHGRERESIMICEIAAVHDLDLDKIRAARNEAVEARSSAAAEAKEREEYERLNRKYGAGGSDE